MDLPGSTSTPPHHLVNGSSLSDRADETIQDRHLKGQSRIDSIPPGINCMVLKTVSKLILCTYGYLGYYVSNNNEGC